MSTKEKRIFLEIGDNAKGIVSALLKEYNISSLVFAGDNHASMSFIKKKKGEEKQEKLFICQSCYSALNEIEKDREYCVACGTASQNIKLKSRDKFLKDRVFNG